MPPLKHRRHEKTWVLAVDTRGTTTTAASSSATTTAATTTVPAEIIPFKHPRTARVSPFVLFHQAFYDVQFLTHPIVGDELKEGPASWFVGDTVVSDGRLGMVTPIDPLFLALPFVVIM